MVLYYIVQHHSSTGFDSMLNAVVTCEINFFQNYFSLRRRPSEIILFQLVETVLKLLQNYFAGLLQLTNIFEYVQCH